MEAIKDVIPEVIRALESKKKLGAGDDPQAALKKTLTKRELAHIKFNYFRKGILGISVDSSVWLYQLNLQKEKLLAKLGKHIPKIKEIRLFLGEVK